MRLFQKKKKKIITQKMTSLWYIGTLVLHKFWLSHCQLKYAPYELHLSFSVIREALNPSLTFWNILMYLSHTQYLIYYLVGIWLVGFVSWKLLYWAILTSSLIMHGYYSFQGIWLDTNILYLTSLLMGPLDTTIPLNFPPLLGLSQMIAKFNYTFSTRLDLTTHCKNMKE